MREGRSLKSSQQDFEQKTGLWLSPGLLSVLKCGNPFLEGLQAMESGISDPNCNAFLNTDYFSQKTVPLTLLGLRS